MNKSLYIISIVTAALFAGCSTSDVDQDIEERELAEQQGSLFTSATSDSEVPIRLGSGSQARNLTRSPLNSDQGTGLFATPDGKYLGVFCLAQQPQPTATPTHPGPVAASEIDWTNAASLMSLMTLNQPARVKRTSVGGKIGTVTTTEEVSEVIFRNPLKMNEDTTYHYPMGSWYNYYFYGYYPRQESGLNITSNKITVDFTLDGTQDIIWGKAVPYTDAADPKFPVTDLTTGFNARYFREKASSGVTDQELLPHLAMTHNLTMLKFYVMCDDFEGYDSYVDLGTSRLQLKDMTIDRLPLNWTLTVADREGGEGTEGKLTLTDPSIGLGSIAVYGFEGGEYTDNNAFAGGSVEIPRTDNRAEAVLVGYAMIPSTEMVLSALDDMSPFMADHNGQNLKNPFINMTLMLNDKPVEGTPQIIGDESLNLEAGKIYNVFLRVKVPDILTARATLSQWSTVELTEDSDQNIDQVIQ